MKNLTPATACIAAALTGLAAASSSALELTTNGGFETGDTSGWVEFVGPPERTFGVTSDAASGAFAGDINNTLPGNPAVVKQANLGVGEVVPGETIEISFDAKGEFGVGSVGFAEFFSEIDGGGVSKAEILGGGPLSLTGAYQTFTFTAVAGSDVSGGVTLQFNPATAAIIGTTARMFVDNVSVSVARVPEPASLALLTGGVLTLLARRRRVG